MNLRNLNILPKITLKKINNDRGAALIFAYFMISALLTLSMGFALSTVNELNHARRYRDSTAAFWRAESGVNEFLHDTTMLDTNGQTTITYGSDTVHIVKDDSDPDVRLVTVTGTVHGVHRQIQLEFPANPPEVFNNTISVKGNISLSGRNSTLNVHGKTRLSGSFSNTATNSTVTFEDKVQGVNPNNVVLTYPDDNHNGTPDEFADFVQHTRDTIATYPSNEVVYIQGNGTYTINPNDSLIGKKIVYIEGAEGSGDVSIHFNAAWVNGQNLTIISTGSVTYNQPNSAGTTSQLNVIAWEGYSEPAALSGSHEGMIYTHGVADYHEVNETSTSTGSVTANGGMTFREVVSTKVFNYNNATDNGQVPPGFEGLVGSHTAGYATTPSSWREI